MIEQLSHFQLVIMLTKAGKELGIEKPVLKEDVMRLFTHVAQQAYEHGHEKGYDYHGLELEQG